MIILPLVFLSIAMVSCFEIQTASENNLQANIVSIPWPYSICGTGKFEVQTVNFSQVPQKSNNLTFDIVSQSLFRLP